jgi:hypothetical protein
MRSRARALAALFMGSIAVACGGSGHSAGAAAIYAGAALAVLAAQAAAKASHGCGGTGRCSSYESCVNGTCCVPCGVQCCGDRELCFDDETGTKRCATKCTSGVQECTSPNTCCGTIDGLGHCSNTGTHSACIPEGLACTGAGGLRSTENQVCR